LETIENEKFGWKQGSSSGISGTFRRLKKNLVGSAKI
jgi:hypothetical protein